MESVFQLPNGNNGFFVIKHVLSMIKRGRRVLKCIYPDEGLIVGQEAHADSVLQLDFVIENGRDGLFAARISLKLSKRNS